MDKQNPFWTRAYQSVRRFLSQPLLGGKKPQDRPVQDKQQQPAGVGLDSEQQFDDAAEAAGRPYTDATVVAGRPSARPEAPRVKPATAELWGREFSIVSDGLAREQVVAFVDNLISKYKESEEQQKHVLSLGELTERTAIEADKTVAGVKARIRSEAEAEAARIVAEANQRIQEMMDEARRAAQDATRQEVQTIIEAALRKAAIIELQAKQQAQQFLIRSRVSIEGDLREEVKEAYYRLFSSLHNMLGEGNRLELVWRDRTGQLRRADTYELEGPPERRSALGAEIEVPPPLGVGGGKADFGTAAGSED